MDQSEISKIQMDQSENGTQRQLRSLYLPTLTSLPRIT